MSGEAERMQILEMIEKGKISAEDGLRLLEALNGDQEAEALPAELELDAVPEAAIFLEDGIAGPVPEGPTRDSTMDRGPDNLPATGETLAPESDFPADIKKWRQWWMIPLWIGIAITISAGFLMYWAQRNSGISLGFICAGAPFLIGVVILALAWQSRRTPPWLHLRVHQKPGERPQRIAFSFPLPVRPAAWFLRTFGHKIPQLENTSVDEVIAAVGASASPDNPIYIQVDEGDDGEKVEIFIG